MPQDITPDVATEVIPAGFFNATAERDEPGNRESIKQLLFLVFKWRWLILCLSLVFMTAAGAAMYLKPTVRTANAKVLFKTDRVALQMADLETKVTNTTQVLESEIELLKSRGVLIPVAKLLLAQETGSEGGIAEVTEQEIEDRVRYLETHIVATALPDTNVIAVTYSSPSPEESVRTLSALLEQYKEQHAVAYGGSAELMKFYDQERDRAGKNLQDAEEKLRGWQAATSIVSVDEQIKSLLNLQAGQVNRLQSAESETELLREEKDPVLSKLKTELISAEVGLQELLQRYTEEDRRVQEKRELIALLRKEMAAATRSLQSTLVTTRDTVHRQIRESTAALAVLREKKVEFERLAREVEIHNETFLLYSRKVEEARIAAGLDRNQLSSIATIEQPYASPKTDFEQRMTIVMLAAFIGLAIGVVTAVGLALFNGSLRMEEDVETYLRLPVLAVIPDLPRSVSS